MGEDARPVRRPIIHNRLLRNRQIRISPTKIAKELLHHTTSANMRSEELTSTWWERQRRNTRRHQKRVEVRNTEDRLEDFRFGEEHPSGVQNDPNTRA